jgi:putative endonuclease
MAADWYLYLIRCNDRSLYTGISTDVERRFIQHKQSGDTGSKYLKGRGPLILVFQKKVGSKSTALKLEMMIKKLSRIGKERLIASPETIEGMITRASE